MEIFQYRGGLPFTERALQSGMLRIGYLGGSITENKVPHNWTEPFLFRMMERWPNVQFVSENAAIGATGSDLGIIHVDSHILPKQCNLVFIEYAVNDWGTLSADRFCAMEGIVRKLLARGQCDIVFVYTFCIDMYDYLARDELPPVVREYESLAAHYNIPSVYAGAYAYGLNRRGFLKWEEWLPDGLHPQFRGSLEYGNSVFQLVSGLLDGSARGRIRRDAAPLREDCWENAKLLPLEETGYRPPFYLRRTATQAYVPYVLTANADGAVLEFTAACEKLYLVFDFGSASCEFRYSVDGQDRGESERDRPAWCGASGWLRPFRIDCGSRGRHTVRLEIVHGRGDGCRGTAFDLAYILQI